jgi:hypothetical protein
MSTSAMVPPWSPGMRSTSFIRRGVKALPAPSIVILIGRSSLPGRPAAAASCVCAVWPMALGFFETLMGIL